MGGGGGVDPQAGKEGGAGVSTPLPSQARARGSFGTGKWNLNPSCHFRDSPTMGGRGSTNVPFLPSRTGGTPILTEINMLIQTSIWIW